MTENVIRCANCGVIMGSFTTPPTSEVPLQYRAMYSLLKAGDLSRVIIGILKSECIGCKPISTE